MNIVERWVQYASERTESPEKFHRYMGYVAVSTAVGRRLWLNWPGGKLFPNLFILTVAQSASFKSTALNMIKRVIRRIDEQAIIPDDFTDASLNAMIGKYTQGVITIDEFSRILKAEEGAFAQVKNTLTSIYDCPEVYNMPARVKDNGNFAQSASYPVFSVCALSTAEGMMQTMSIDDMKSGFMTRFMIVSGSSSDRTFPLPPGDDDGFITEVATRLRSLRDGRNLGVGKQVQFSEEAKRIYSDWYTDVKGRLSTKPNYIELSGSVVRLRIYAIKFAMLEAVLNWADDENTPTIKEEEIRKGIAIAEEGLKDLFASMSHLEVASSKDKMVQILHKARQFFVKHRDMVTRTELYSAMKRATKKDIDMVISTLIDSGEIMPSQGYNGRQAFRYTGTEDDGQ